MRRSLAALVFILSGSALAGANSAPAPFPATAAHPPDDVYVFNASFTPDSRTLYFSRATAHWKAIHLYVTHFRDGKWTPAVRLPLATGKARDTDPFMSTDGKTLYFASDRASGDEAFRPFHYRIWKAIRRDGEWSAPQLAEATINSLAPVVGLSFTNHGDAVVFRMSKQGGGLYRLHRKADGSLGVPAKIRIPNAVSPSDPVISRDGRTLYFIDHTVHGSSTRLVYRSRHTTKGWTPREAMPADVNLGEKQLATGLSPDNRVLFFSSSVASDAHGERRVALYCHALTNDSQNGSLPPPLKTCVSQ